MHVTPATWQLCGEDPQCGPSSRRLLRRSIMPYFVPQKHHESFPNVDIPAALLWKNGMSEVLDDGP
jgi:hypothetical protein